MIFSKKCVLRDHQMAHKREKPYKCEICEKTFTQRGNLKTHQKCHNNQNGFKCTFENCNKTFATKSYLKIHLKSHIGLKECVCTYPDCGKKFYHRGNLKYHEQKKHPDMKLIFPYECSHSKCNLKFKSLEELMKHHYQAEPTCAKEKQGLIELFLDMENFIKNHADVNVINEIEQIKKDTINKLNGKSIFIDTEKDYVSNINNPLNQVIQNDNNNNNGDNNINKML